MTSVMEPKKSTTESPTENEAVAAHHATPRYYDFNMPIILLVGIISTILVLITIFFVQGLCYQWQNSYIRQRSTDYVNSPVQEIIDNQKQMLNGNAETGVTPITETMQQIVDQYGKK